ncbi:MAG: SMP-30/gluconolactonase/LRE family protein [Betaproteobacteria bacterium]
MQPRIEIVADLKNALGEGPIWDQATQRIYWLDGVAGRIFRCKPDGSEVRTWEVPCRIGSMALRENGGAIVALASGLHLLDFETGGLDFVADPESDLEDNCLNDGKVDREGRFVFGSMDTREQHPSGALYQLDANFKISKLEEGIICSNGPCWSPDGRTFYFQDSYDGEIRAYDYSPEGTLSNRRTFAKLVTETGAADGSTVDEAGYLWNAQVFDGLLVRYAPDGTVDRCIEMPVRKATSVCFGGPRLDVLFVTSMGKQLHPHFPTDGPQKGALFAVYDLGVRGIAEPRFRG